METISLPEARRIVINSQFACPGSSARDKKAVKQVIEHLGYVQIDTISVIARAHHHVLWSRTPDYSPDLLRELEEQDRAVYEYWAHAAAYLPVKDYRYSLLRKDEFLNGDGHWFPKNNKNMTHVLERIQAEGPLMSRDFKSEIPKSSSTGMDWARNPLNLALRQLFMEGRIMVIGRRGFQKVYDLPERVLPPGVNTEPPTREEYIRHLIRRDVRAHGLVKAREIGYLLKNIRNEVVKALKKMVRSGEIVEVKIEKIAEPYFAFPETLPSLSASAPAGRLHILSPFDNLIIQRSRLEELFGLAYTLECYVPAAKRKFGYFGLPLLTGDTFVGQIDLKADRKAGTLMIRNLAWAKKWRQEDQLWTLLHHHLKSFARFNSCGRIEVDPKLRKSLPGVRLLEDL